MKRKNTCERFTIENGSKQPLMCPLKKKNNDYKIRGKICNDKIIVMGEAENGCGAGRNEKEAERNKERT